MCQSMSYVVVMVMNVRNKEDLDDDVDDFLDASNLVNDEKMYYMYMMWIRYKTG